MNEETRRLTRAEINLLKHLVRVAPVGFPVTVPRKLTKGILSAWRLGLIEVWYRQSREVDAGRRAHFVSITVFGQKRIHALLANAPVFPSRRLARPQGQGKSNDQSSEPRQEQVGDSTGHHGRDRPQGAGDG